MIIEERVRWLRTALYSVGGIFVVGYPLLALWIWPGGFAWTPAQSEYDWMMVGIYATLGIFLLRAARSPLEHASLIWFTVWSSLVHGGIMLVQALADSTDRANLLGDIPALFLVAGVLGLLMPRSTQLRDARAAPAP